MTAAPLTRIEKLRFTFGPEAAREKRRLFAALGRTRFTTARDLSRFHEALVYTRAYPDDEATLALAERLLRGFAKRADLTALRGKLEDSGIAGTDTRFRFFASTALRLATRFPERLTYDWARMDDTSRLEELLPLLAAHGETPGMDEYDLGLRGWLDRMRGPKTGDAAFVTTRLAARVRDPQLFEKLHDGVDAAMTLAWGPGGPSRTNARWPGASVTFQRGPLRKGRPDLREELMRPPVAITPLSRRDGERVLAMCMEAMVTRSRDLDVFAYGDPSDVRMVDCGDGLQFACVGALPSRRLLLESVYGMLTLKNGVPTGYVLTSALFGSAEIAYNVFETYRGGEAGAVYGRVLAMTKALFGVDSFTVYPYQLGGAGNEEGLASGAWWVYRKLGFAPRDRAARALVRREEARMAKHPEHRSSRATLMTLGESNVYWHEGAKRDDVIGLLPLANVGLAVTDLLAKRFGGEGERGAAACVREAAKLLGAGPASGWSAGERQSFERWAPLALLLSGVSRWSAAEKRALAHVMRAKGGVRETDFVRAFDGHAKLRAAVARLAEATKA
ncbi:MAG: hypothetical protein HZA61_03765 [Candidatus Eisenbacteria bacterium]|uniref:Uncharacterized protein n=1 Tax=Eiseniibacteriota bacterium TaxID=2212470 RepID=A0A933SBD7_UNCEI|nr:hypothetical protein [Candidatus Eisenbacteria bacterium]